MSKTNPRKAMAAILPLPIRTTCGETVRPMTLGMYAALERIGSPMVTGAEPKDTLELIPSLYLITHDPREVFRGNVLDLAMQWADTKPVETLREIREAALMQMRAMIDVVPQKPEDAPEKKTTDGSPTTRPTRRKPSDGATKQSCGKSPRASSRSCGDRKKSEGRSQGSGRSL